MKIKLGQLRKIISETITEAYGSGFQIDSYSETYPADDLKSIMNSIKYVVGNSNYSFKRYGKPTKNFKWIDKSLVGLNVANLTASIAQARGE